MAAFRLPRPFCLALAVLLLSSCSSSGTGDALPAEPTEGRGSAAAEAWNAEIDQVMARTTSPSVRDVLSDHVITEAEISRLRDELADCLKPVGVTDIQFSEDGVGYETNTPDIAADALVARMDECEETVGYEQIALLYNGMLSNPAKADRTSDVVDCMVEKGLVPSGYTVEDYRRATDSQSLPFEENDANMQLFAECTSTL